MRWNLRIIFNYMTWLCGHALSLKHTSWSSWKLVSTGYHYDILLSSVFMCHKNIEKFLFTSFVWLVVCLLFVFVCVFLFFWLVLFWSRCRYEAKQCFIKSERKVVFIDYFWQGFLFLKGGEFSHRFAVDWRVLLELYSICSLFYSYLSHDGLVSKAKF